MSTIGDYEYSTQKLLGKGGFGEVFEGRSIKNRSTVAIKRINLEKTKIIQIEKEMTIMTTLRHENIVALFDLYGQLDKKQVFLVMELCDGGDLSNYLRQNRRLNEDTILLFLRQLANGMKELFANRIIHRDLKPQNILLTRKVPNPLPSQITLKIADFGISRFLQDGFMAGTYCGTPLYMAPEVCRHLPYDAKADLWSLGIIVFECLTLHRPFGNNQLNDRIPRIPHGTSAELNDLLLKLLKHDPKQRINFEQFFNHPFLRGQHLRPPVNQHLVQQNLRPPFNQHQHLRHHINQNFIQQHFIRPFNQQF